MIINIRGTNGSGKTWTVRQLINAYAATPIMCGKYIEGYQCGGARVVGRYDRPSGGCDAIKTQDEVCNLVRSYSAHGPVIFEGLLVSGIFDRYRKLSSEYIDYRWVFLNTPLDICLGNISARRMQVGKSKEFDPVNVISEGIRVNAGPTRWAELAANRDLDVRFVLLATTFEGCKEGVLARRKLRGNDEPLTPITQDGILDHCKRLRRFKELCRKKKFNFVELPSSEAVGQILTWLQS